MKDEEYEETMFCGENMVNIVNRIKLPPNLKDAINNLTDVAKSIPERVNELVM